MAEKLDQKETTDAEELIISMVYTDFTTHKIPSKTMEVDIKELLD